MFSLLFVINVFCEENKTIPVSVFDVILNEINMDETKIKDVAIKLNIVTENKTIDEIKLSIVESLINGLKGKDGQPGTNGTNGTNGKDGKDGKDGKSIGLSDLAKSFKVSLTKKDDKGNEVNKSADELIAEINEINANNTSDKRFKDTVSVLGISLKKSDGTDKTNEELNNEVKTLINKPSELTKDLDIIKKVLYYGVAPVTGIITLYILFKGFLSKNNNNNVEQEN